MARTRRGAPEINASSMADIAFLLLIFFLVTTTIDTDKGIIHKLPPWNPDQPPPEDVKVQKRNTLIVLVNAQDYLLVNGDYEKISNLRERTKKFIDNRGRDPESSDSPQKAVVSLQNDRGTSYNMYIQVQNEVKAAYRELREEFAMKKFGKPFDKLTDEEAKVVRDEYPLKISEADPKNLGEQK
jgi:biopolymer transport protein ExbD